ncbi:MAG TPA: NAD(P)-dependent oxidoreductase [Prolixibacteraceae bacterium]|nr:NAD(P)-dependent oxidoreductase [Prolixibacteraceae bacterium]
MIKVLNATEKPFSEKAINQILMVIKQADYQFELLEKYTSKSELLKAVENVDALIVRSDIIDAEVLDAAKNLKIIVRAGSGYDNIDLGKATEKGVVVMNTPGQNSNAVAELAIGLALYGIRNLFSGTSGGELRGRNIGLHGYGYVARNVKRIARGFEMNPVVYTRYSRAQAISEGLQVSDSLEELYAMSDIISIHVPARGEHIKSVSYQVLQHLRLNAIIVNTARKEVINEDELIRFMRFRPDVKYLSDIAPNQRAVFEKNFKGRFFFTPQKMGAQTAEANLNAGVAAAQQIVNFFTKEDKTYQVNK